MQEHYLHESDIRNRRELMNEIRKQYNLVQRTVPSNRYVELKKVIGSVIKVKHIIDDGRYDYLFDKSIDELNDMSRYNWEKLNEISKINKTKYKLKNLIDAINHGCLNDINEENLINMWNSIVKFRSKNSFIRSPNRWYDFSDSFRSSIQSNDIVSINEYCRYFHDLAEFFNINREQRELTHFTLEHIERNLPRRNMANELYNTTRLPFEMAMNIAEYNYPRRPLRRFSR